ncbi:DNA mismatch repair endonuclease MutL [Borrelia miyamotoi]|uniref:DNA mismatch repair protein MutL n=1 Tax=Borrelia miyamotoi TaxID=47466 RepID=A0AAX3JMP8_9SPIR|nr:DNA mismatch repair endonuclease MutL [Borrelia miyamotoi]QFP42103.1 DNA mismatch repair endonuclease MutL [Borrelia miyamotoi]QFP48217.1 DNA mismatch repair endonuclease MutL [Borrelia miyamotoi]QGT55977.1 DNA mismatch repair endonuclease MutL [Borrelia miyamotoi]QGT56757.1 DNA mismatch repair endonuclease MutL [Borrelia miyamotoi]WAZ72018.1 DNA mismatch repair endonuclease MutL [Borrelia miyamotoi]
MNKIKFLDKGLVQKIAAGEAIDRPCSVLRELLDNAIDSGADKIEVFLEEGGIRRILIIDNGSGISQSDLKICYLPHTTSKITEEQDLEKIKTLGFRGEALSSIAICSNLTITSSITGEDSYQIEVENGIEKYFKKQSAINGTIVDITNLFHNLPARKRFLKKDSVETKMCIKVFEEKAVTHPNIDFKLSINNELRKVYFKESLIDRVQSVYGEIIENNKFGKIEAKYESVKMQIFFAPPNFSRKDRRNIKIFVNRRPVEEKSLLSAIIDGHRRILTNRNFPICYLFLEIDPIHVDFNIHPQKKEVRFFNLPFLPKQIANNINEFFDREKKEILQDYHNIIIKRQLTNDAHLLQSENDSTNSDFQSYEITKNKALILDKPQNNKITNIIEDKVKFESQNPIYKDKPSFKNHIQSIFLQTSKTINKLQKPIEKHQFKYMGQLFSEFLIVENHDEVYFIDQHALHEKIIYQTLINSKKIIQKLLVPIEFQVDFEDTNKILESELEEYKKIDIIVTKIKEQTYQLESIPNICNKYENIIIQFLKTRQSKTIDSLKAELYATIACRQAIKSNDIISPEFSKFLINEFFNLKLKHCPHGRKIYHKLSKFDLEKSVNRK